MIYITGDCHSDYVRFSKENFPEQEDMTKDDYMIICGDFGGVWNMNEESKREKWWLNWLENKSYTTLFVDGNHENFDRLNSYPVEEWNGGKVRKIRPSVLHLMRGQVFQLAGKKIFTFGGAASHDISGGILEPDDPDFKAKKKELDQDWKPYRINHVSWWAQELPSEKEMQEGIYNLSLHGNKVDFIMSHCCSSSTQALIGEGMYKSDMLTQYFEQIQQKVTYKKWFFGHYHDNKNVNAKEVLLYDQVIRVL